MPAEELPLGLLQRASSGALAYLRTTTSLLNSLMLILPVFAAYQAGVIYQLASSAGGSFSINGADFITHNVLKVCRGTVWLYVLFVVVTALGLGWLMAVLARRDRLNRRVFLPLVIESGIYAVLFAGTIHLISSAPQLLVTTRGLSLLTSPTSEWEMLFQSFGAGLNEELLFRLGLLGGIAFLGRVADFPRLAVVVLAFLLSALAFSLFHYVGPYADGFAFDSFMYRFLAGILLGLIYWWRGLAVAVYTHAFYDLYFFFTLGA